MEAINSQTINRNKTFYTSEETPRERLETFGAEALTNQELLAIILCTGSKNQNVLDVANNLLITFDGLSGMRDVALAELTKQDGVGYAKACRLLAAIEIGKRIFSVKQQYHQEISSTSVAAQLMLDRMRNLDREQFQVMHLNKNNCLISIETVSIGIVDCSLSHPREIFKQAIKQSDSSIILAHNHPSGNILPSHEDIEMTKRLEEAGELIGIQVLDHLIIGRDSYFSFHEHELIG